MIVAQITSVAFAHNVRVPPNQELRNRVWTKLATQTPQDALIADILASEYGIHVTHGGVTRLYPWHLVEHVEYNTEVKDASKNKL